MAPRSQRPRASSWHCRQNGWLSGWRRTCPSWTSWSSRSTGPLSEPRLQLINPSTSPNELNTTLTPHSIIHGDACFAYFNKIWGTPHVVKDGCCAAADVEHARAGMHDLPLHAVCAHHALEQIVDRRVCKNSPHAVIYLHHALPYASTRKDGLQAEPAPEKEAMVRRPCSVLLPAA